MCGRYRIDDGSDSLELHELIEQANRRSGGRPVKSSGEIFPADTVPVLATDRRLCPGGFAMRWGYALEAGRRVINARSETAQRVPMFREGMLRHRCAVPATNYYEWERVGGKRVKYAIRPSEGDVFYMAGIYRFESEGPAFSILTRDPAESIAFIHDRMPVILPPELVKEWIDPRCGAGEMLTHAVLSVTHESQAHGEQLSMRL